VRIEVRFRDDVAVFSLSGKFLAGSDGPFLRQKLKDLIEAGTRKLVINFSDVPYIDSTGLGFLAGARVTAQNSGSTLVLTEINEHVRKILDEVRLSQFFVITPNEDSALKKANELSAAAAGTIAEGDVKAEKKKKPAPAAQE
jgi:anti-sigma B factor antagonist